MSDRTPRPAPTDWHDAFAALPLESPPAGGWQRIATQLARPPRRARRALPWAIAAATACLAAMPVLHLLRQPPTPAPDAAAALHVPPDSPLPSTAAPEAATAPVVVDQTEGAATAAAVTGPASTRHAGVASGERPDLESLYLESARLEALLGELSSSESGDGMQLALSASLRSQVAGIDDALADTGLDEGARSGLWRQRVDVLRELAGLAADQRWNALYGGGTTDYALVQVY